MTLEELERRVRVLEDVEAIKQLKARYCERCDDGPYDADGVAALFTEDAVWEGAGFGRFVGREAIRAFFRTGPSTFSFTIHQATNPIIEVDGDRARGRWYLMQPGTMVDGNRAIWLAAHYEDEYRRVGGRWLFSHLKTTTRFFTPYDEGWGKTPFLASAAMGGVDAAGEWERFCAELARAGEVLRRPATPRDALTQAEGLRYLSRMIRAGLETRLEMADLAHPVLRPMIDRWLLYEGVTSDARYHHTLLDGAHAHRVSGTRGTAPLFEIGVYTGKQAIHETSHLLASLTESELRVEPDGRFEVALGPQRRPGNWLRTDERARYLMIREYAPDWSEARAGSFEIRREDSTAARPPLRVEDAREGLAGAAEFVARASAFWASLSDYWAGIAPNRFLYTPRGGGVQLRRLDDEGRELEARDYGRLPDSTADARTEVAPPAGHQFTCGWFRLEEGEALCVRFAPKPAPYWGLELTNYWYEPLCFGTRRSIVNVRTAVREPDGTVRAVVAARDPGLPNWLDSDGHREGMMNFRLSRSDDAPPEIGTELVRLDDLRRRARA